MVPKWAERSAATLKWCRPCGDGMGGFGRISCFLLSKLWSHSKTRLPKTQPRQGQMPALLFPWTHQMWGKWILSHLTSLRGRRDDTERDQEQQEALLLHGPTCAFLPWALGPSHLLGGHRLASLIGPPHHTALASRTAAHELVRLLAFRDRRAGLGAAFLLVLTPQVSHPHRMPMVRP